MLKKKMEDASLKTGLDVGTQICWGAGHCSNGRFSLAEYTAV